jgi:hypothetical protein
MIQHNIGMYDVLMFFTKEVNNRENLAVDKVVAHVQTHFVK